MRSRRYDTDTDETAAARPDTGPQPEGPELLDLQRLAGNQAVNTAMDDQASAVLDVVGSGGRPLDPAVRTEMESRLGADFGDVRVHTGGSAEASAAAVDAAAYTIGSDIVFGQGAYDPASTAGLTTLAHELTHVVQQRSGPVEGTPADGGIAISDPGDRFEQEAAATAHAVVHDER